VVLEVGVQVYPQSFDLSKNPGKTNEDVRKIPENLGKQPEIADKNGAQRGENHMNFFWRPSHKNYSGKNISHPQKFACSPAPVL